MSTSPYSKDLRVRVIKKLKEGNSYKECAKLFELSISTIGRWYRRYKQEGHCQAKARPGAERKINVDFLESYVKLFYIILKAFSNHHKNFFIKKIFCDVIK